MKLNDNKVIALKLATRLQLRLELIMCHRYVGNDIILKAILRQGNHVVCFCIN